MALTLLSSVVATNGTTDSVTSASFTPANSSLLVAISTGLVPDGETAPATISGGGLTWTQRLRKVEPSSGWCSAIYIWTAPVTTGSSMTVTVDSNATTSDANGGFGLEIINISGHSSYTPGQTFAAGSASSSGITGAYNGDFASPAVTSSFVIATLTANSNGNTGEASTGTGWTQLSETAQTYFLTNTQYRTGVASTDITWDWFDPVGNFSWAVGAIEIATTNIPFTDNFNRTSGDLETTPTASGGGNWVHDGLIAHGLQVSGNVLFGNTTDTTGTAYKTPNQGTADHYVQFKAQSTTVETGPFACCRLTDRSNFVGIRTGFEDADGRIAVYRRVSGSLTNLYTSSTDAYTAGDIIRLEVSGTDFTVKKNGVVVTGPTWIGTSALTSSDTGIVARYNLVSTFDDFEAGPLSIALVQSAEGRSAGVANTAVSFSTLPTAGNLIALAWTGNAYVEGFRPEQDGWIQATTIRASRGAYLWWRIADGVNGNAANPWEFSQTTSATRATWVMAEFSGVDQIDYASMYLAAGSSVTTMTTPSLVPGSGERLLIAALAAADSNPGSLSDDDLTSWTNSFTHIRSHGESSNPGEASSITGMAYRVVTGDDSTSYSTGATFPKTVDTPYAGVASFKAVGNLSATTAPALRDIASITYGSRTNTTCDKPTGTVDGDILIATCFQGQSSGTLSNFTAPSGWRLLQGDFEIVGSGGFNGRLLVYWKRASSEASTYTFTHATSSTQVVITAWSGCVATGTPVDGWAYNGASNAGGEWGQISPNSTNTRLIAVDHNWSGDAKATISGVWTEHYDAVLMKVQSRELTDRGPTGQVPRANDFPWEGYLVALRGPPVYPNIAEATGNQATVSVGSVTVDITSGITQTGSTLQIGVNNSANTGTVSSTITVPSDAQLVIVGVSGYAGPVNAWGGAPFESMTFTKGGTDTAMTKVYGGDSKNAVEWQGAMFYLAAPDTGTNKTLKWNWQGTDTLGDANLNFSITFWTGVDAADPVRHQAGNHSGAVGSAAITVTNPLIAQTGDKIVAWCGFFRADGTGDGAGSIDTWTNLTELTEVTHQNYAEGAWATGDPTGNVLVGIASGTNVTQPNLLAVTLRKAGSVQRRDGDLAHITSIKAFHGYQVIAKTATFTPANNSRLVVVSTALVPAGEAGTHTINATISGGGLTWTRHKRAYYYDPSQWASVVYIWTAPVTTGASMAVTVTYSPSSAGTDGGYGLDVFELPDSYAVIQTFEDGGGSGDVLSGSYDGDFSTAPSSGSYLIAATSINSNTLDGSAMTPGSGWTEVSENVNNFYNSETQYITGTTDTAVTWANLDPNINYSWAVAAIEIGEAGGALYEIDASPGTYTVSGQTATLTKTTVRTIVAAPSSYAIAGQTQTLRKGWKASQTSTGSLSLSGSTASMIKLANNVLPAAPSSYTMSGQTQTLRHGWKTFATTASSYTMSGVAATLLYDEMEAVSVTVNLGSLSLLTLTGTIVWPGGGTDRAGARTGLMVDIGKMMGI